eukprot:scaffold7998_cov417-Prasinococcus_capsulatus_cf.AAC.6
MAGRLPGNLTTTRKQTRSCSRGWVVQRQHQEAGHPIRTERASPAREAHLSVPRSIRGSLVMC